ncbi:hypothetical protein AAA587_08070 [Pseudomonas aeruginosa]|uniref:hypothetical protein n=1 Tax=Pseudomonas aeruginosa TaxID=287 RepID=UPI000FC407BC|nr:hypothetical protein [Pseudomonas aeruginosa]MDV2682068.1 hypothetical protein [Pseudomonas aeruginosa]MDV2731206.1 hypothetical protein [Pseudomonas aeruginosa]RUE18300.1 hypothetical protein IPC1232_24755 [Pseudomonas aeruginosa]HBO2162648.1 hypothetical protein [Pseudomonas aeruginosa]HBO2165966.1 hypothetical protein [Pseudomonas aeruginosa]
MGSSFGLTGRHRHVAWRCAAHADAQLTVLVNAVHIRMQFDPYAAGRAIFGSAGQKWLIFFLAKSITYKISSQIWPDNLRKNRLLENQPDYSRFKGRKMSHK